MDNQVVPVENTIEHYSAKVTEHTYAVGTPESRIIRLIMYDAKCVNANYIVGLNLKGRKYYRL